MTEALNDIGLLLALPIGIFVYFFRRWWDRSRMRQSMARILHAELSVNADIFMGCKISSIGHISPVYDDVYRGLLTSGNMHYLSAYQYRLHSLYSSLRHDDKNKSTLLMAIMTDLYVVMDCPFGRLCQLNPIPHVTHMKNALRRKMRRR
ncbi:MAG: hypothetical protein OXC91_15030 [Rhodobacteraceae bacterium]|nr:hypothetical protein [Paracoccaceae bacterium]